MATVTITEILGGDNIAASRIVLNNNFTLLQNAINTLETRLNTSYVPGGSLNVGDAQILKYTRPLTQNIFLVQASAQIDGNLSLGTPTFNSTLNITGGLTATQSLTVNRDVTFTNTTNAFTLTNSLSTTEDDSLAHTQWYNSGLTAGKNNYITAAQINANTGNLAAVITDWSNIRVLHLDASAVTAGNETLQIPAVGALNVVNGQIITIVFDNVNAAGLTFQIDNTSFFATPFSNATLGSNIILNNAFIGSDPRFPGIWIDLVATAGGWKVIGAHTSVLYV